ncbi:hypothetical protein LCGC14_0796150 [marine sediment metagenome]|uniref:MATE family efflux transporter n=2 Tax=root TaxID=1 RepID=A0A831VTH0_9FLAO|nr:MATE family efflux transporter [Pricia sp.]HEA23207.1 MATE family efflux transporter [Pricia antarctica]
MTSANRVIINTAISYGRMVLTVGVSLYSTRLILEALGNTDFGIFQLVGGLVAMLAFLKNTMATATQRFLSFYQGKNEAENQKSVFTNSLIMHIVIGLAIVLILASLEPILFERFLNIPESRTYAAKIVYRTVLASLFFSMVNVPFIGSLIAHENLLFVALINILEALLKLAIALILIDLDTNKLIVYGCLMAALDLITLLFYMGFCLKTYEECSLKAIKIDRGRIKELTSFAGWNLFGSLCSLGRNQGLAIVLNLFFGAVINAAYGIANQLSSQMNLFSVTMLRALNPQIMKSEGSNNRERMLRLSMIASKFGFFLAAIVAIPAIFEMTAILKFWLKEVPDYTVIFAQLILISILVNQLTIGLQSALQATGKIKLYQIVVGGLILMTLPVAYLFLEMGYPPYSVFVSYLLFEIIAVVLRLLIAKKITHLSIPEYMTRVFSKSLLPFTLLVGTCYYISNYWNMDYRFIITGIISSVVFISTIYLFGLCNDEKLLVIKFFNIAKGKLKNK